MFTGTPKLNQEFLEELANLEFQESLLAAVSRGDLKHILNLTRNS